MMKAKTAIVTGATSGIGAAISRSLVAQGFNIMMAGRRTEKLEALAAQLGETAKFTATDVSKRDDVLSLVNQTNDAFGQVDVLINNAGIMPISLYASRKVGDWDKMIDVNLKGTLYGIDAVLPQMIERQSGHIINVASIAGLQTGPAFGVYSATKSGVRVLSEGLRQEVASQNIRVTTISPGTIETELFGTITDPAVLEVLGQGLSYQPMQPQEIADTVVFALSQSEAVCMGEIVVRPTGQGAMN